MATAIGILGVEPAIDLKSKLPATLPSVRLERMVPGNAGNAATKRRATCPLISDSVDPEWVLKVVKEFHDTFPAGRLGLSTGALRFEYFRQLLSGGALRKWDVEANAVGNSLNDFETAISGYDAGYYGDY